MPSLVWSGQRRGKAIGPQSFQRTWGTPDQEPLVRDQRLRQNRYNLLWDLYQGTAFDDVEFWQDYKGVHALYRQIRQLWDHVHALVEFYATHIWYGALAQDGMNLPNGIRNAVPLAQDTDPQVAAAIGQLFDWWVFTKKMVQIPRYTSALGELLVELYDDPFTGEFQIELCWPGRVKDIWLDRSGDVSSYVIEYMACEPDNSAEEYLYRREVDLNSFRIYRDGDLESETENEYGFIPAVWFRHTPLLGVRGEPAIWSTQGQLDDLNSLFANLLDKTHTNLRAPIVVSGNISPTSFQRALTNMVGSVKRAATADQKNPHAYREELNILQGPQGTQVSTIEISIGEAIDALKQLIGSIEMKCPEIRFYDQLRDMTQLTGAGASRSVGDVEHKYRSSCGTYDTELKRLLRKGIAVAGYRRNLGEGAWGLPRDDFKVFDPFTIEDYHNRGIQFDILPRPLVPPTEEEQMALIIQKRAALPFFPDLQAGIEAGYDEETVQKWIDDYEKEQQDKFLQQQQAQIDLAESAPKNPVGAPPGGPQRGQTGPRSEASNRRNERREESS